ncbi:hypothetical protein B0I35DRAFT_483672 [Stachybotrys elegans]|uniref:HD domain-containing protein n=1 Tax=Stachybotrys elegans TaxID=80388 RepID=A0A8K0SBT7_9HYPO|nr:hypothetical protein B0I35DRAFT_483672 [Stachybotrys elegans]
MATQESSIIPESLMDRIPKTKVCTEATALASKALPAAIFNHSLRVYLIAQWVAEREASEYSADPKLSLLFVAAICHDIGTSHLHNEAQRFEVEGADVAESLLRDHGVSHDDSHRVWVAIAVHTSAGIAERIDPLSRLIRLAVKADFSTSYAHDLGAGELAVEIEKQLPRLDIERTLADAVVKQAAEIPEKVDSLTWPSTEKHPSASWPGILLRAHVENPGYEGVNPAF